MYFYEDPKDTAYSVSVEVGDQVIFRYHGQQVNPVDQLSQGGNTWNVVMRIRNPLSNQCVNPGNAVKFEYLNIWVVLVDEILVGESKYYYLAGNDDDGWGLKDDWRPGMPVPARKTEVTFSVVPPIEGGRPAVYWEEKKPMTSAPKQPLPDGIIRLVGRFFDADDQQKNTVQLTASFITGYGEDYTSIDAEVKKPARLLTPGQSPTYRLSRDVFDNEMSIDSICIAYGGRYGVPPHFLKGHMRQEAGRKDFGAYTGLAPSYRYEPFSRWAQLSNAWKLDERYNGGLWIVDPKRTGYEMGTGKMIPMHQNVCDMPYPRSPKSVWDILWDNSEIVNTGTDVEHRVYGKRLADGRMNFPKEYSGICNEYARLLLRASFYSYLLSKTKEQIAREDMIVYLRDKWEGGAKSMVAQTRLASSYGLLQMMYSTAVEQIDYPSTDPNIRPEDFNVTDIGLFYCLEYMKMMLEVKLTTAVEQDGNWPKGFEYYFKKYIWPTWNPGNDYPKSVYSYTQRFLPQSK
jgi:hypothetical protein